MWLHFERIWMAFITILVLYLLCYGGLIIWHFISRKSVPIQKLKVLRNTLRRLAPFIFILVVLAYIVTLNVPINFTVVGLLLLIFWKPVKNISYGLILPLYRKLEKGDEIKIGEENIIIDSIGSIGIRGQGVNGQVYINYDELFEKNLHVIKSSNSKKLYSIELIPPKDIALEGVRSDLLEILSNQSLIDHNQLPRITSHDIERRYTLEVYLRGESDPEDLTALLREKGYHIYKT